MRILALDTTAAVASVALWADGAVVAEKTGDSKRKHAETIVPLVDELLRENGLTAKDIDLFAADIGPGSFTGIRIGVSVANALAYAAGKRIVGVGALETLAEPLRAEGKPVLAMIDARNGNAYAACYAGEETLLEPCAEAVTEILSRVPENALRVGDTPVDGVLPKEELRLPKAACVAAIAARRAETAVAAVTPVYLRPSQAERMKKER
ncbi:MAG: tRNA (adenosine(37)-N6)-threonylcarbamoyltransferase complex dimerization subunit type 1 TsaB [Clostridia bacterium]|nr:tRNA (adenosine(37)-N6)-threonylcarbamoyltransferase complex dimerization subunit type 1 TsaB [Clostridia bacterium]